MSEEEIINYLKEIIEEIEYRHKGGGLILVNDITTGKLYYSIKCILDLYKKEKEENKELKEHLKKYYNGELFTAKQLKSIEENQKKYFVNKSKIKEKIEELKNKEHNEYLTNYYGTKEPQRMKEFQYKIEVLQELLEE